uniref:Uncharacterized protein n=1 Tax=Hubei tetragnatha maxillosa virus 9 TaxID=1923251 RepID=A0A1L3KP42_9VIRU|nr:hypothetical protein 1 [Hubei tetragnatha maxillosa virus 9]
MPNRKNDKNGNKESKEKKDVKDVEDETKEPKVSEDKSDSEIVKDVKDASKKEDQKEEENESDTVNVSKGKEDVKKDEKGAIPPLKPDTSVVAETSTGKVEVKEDEMVNKSLITSTVILDLLGVMKDIISTSQRMVTSQTVLKFTGRLVDIPFRLVEKYDPYFTIETYGVRKRLYIRRKPLLEAKFTNLDTFLEYVMGECFDKVLDEASKVLHIEEAKTLLDNRIDDPNVRGFPYDEFGDNSIDMNNVINAIRYLLGVAENVDYNWRIVNTMRDNAINAIAQRLIEYSVNGMEELRSNICRFVRNTNRGIAPNLIPPLFYPNDLFSVVSRYDWLPRIMSQLGYSLAFTSQAIIELTSPRIILNSVDAKTVVSGLGQNTGAITGLSNIYSSQMTPTANSEISVWVDSIVCIGYIETQIVDLSLDDTTDNFWTACISKLVFSWHGQRRYRNIHNDSVRQIDQIFVNAGLRSSLWVVVDPHYMGDRPLDNVNPLTNEGREILNGIRTDDNGTGWANDGVINHVDNDPNSGYFPGLERRFNYGVNCDNRDTLRLQGVSNFTARWRTFNALQRMILALKKLKDVKHTAALSSLFNFFSERLAAFYIRLNDYLRLHWYTGFRCLDVDKEGILERERTERIDVKMSASSIRTLFTHIHGNDDLERGMDVFMQIKAEVSAALDLKKAYAKRQMFERILREYNVTPACWSARRQIKMLFDKESPFYVHFERIAVGGNARSILDNLNLVQNDMIRQILVMVSDFIMDNSIRFGFVSRVLFKPHMRRWTREDIERSADNSEPIVDNLVDRDGAVERDLGVMRDALPNGDVMLNLRYQAQAEGVLLQVPLPFEVTVSDTLSCSSDCFKIIYVDAGINLNERNSFGFSKLRKTIIFVDQNKLLRVDTILGELNNFELFHVTQEDLDMFLEAWEDFRASLPQLLTSTRVLRNKKINFKSLFDLVPGGVSAVSC